MQSTASRRIKFDFNIMLLLCRFQSTKIQMKSPIFQPSFKQNYLYFRDGSGEMSLLRVYGVTTIIRLYIMKLVKVCAFAFARRGKNAEPSHSYQEIVHDKAKRMQYYEKKYDFYELFQHEDKYFQEYVYGHTCYIAGLTNNNYKSQIYTKSMMKYVQPNLLLLGGISDNYFRLYQNFLKIRQHYQHPLYKTQKMSCKQRISRLIQERLEKDDDFFWDDFQKEIKIINTRDKRIQPNEYLTAAHIASGEENTKVALGKPSDTLIFQDLIMRYSVQELKDIAERAISKAMASRSKEKTWRLSFTREIVQNFVMSDFPQLFSKELTYQAALLKRYAKLEDKILMLVPGHFAGRIANQLHQIDIKPENVYRAGLEDKNSETYAQFQKIMQSDPQEILQKFCLLTLLKQSWLELQFANGVNVFRYFCFYKLFEGMDMDELSQRYMQAKRSVEGKWYELMQQRVKNLHLEQGPHFRVRLGEQFKILQQRVTKNFPYTYEQKNYLSMHEDSEKLMKLENRMREMLNEEGDKFKIELFEEFKKGYRSKEGIILYAKLLGKANIQSYDRLKLPVFHYGAFRGIYKEYLRDFMLKAEENSQFQQKLRKKEKRLEEMADKFIKKLDDPDQLHKAITGKLGKVINLSFDPKEGPKLSEDELEQMKAFYGEMTPEKQQQIKDQFGEDWFKIQKDDETK